MDKELSQSIKAVIDNSFMANPDKLKTIASFLMLCFEKDYFLMFDLH